MSTRLFEPTRANHYVHLANAWLHGRLDLGYKPPTDNDWACFDTETGGICPRGSHALQGQSAQRHRWYVSFPPLPALVILPAVAVFGLGLWDALFWGLLAGLAPALLFVVLRWLREAGRSGRRQRDDLVLTALFGLGTVYYFAAVQGSVWFAAQVLGSAFLCLYLLFSLDARRPLWAGLALGLAFLCRPTTAFLAFFFGLEALRVARDRRAASVDPEASLFVKVRQWLAPVRWPAVARDIAVFSVPMAALIGIAVWHNYARFGDPLEFGHSFLQIRWRPRIEKWGLFDYHYLAKNLAIFLASLPWLLPKFPYVKVSQHGLALWVTTPNLLWVLWPKRVTGTVVALWAAILPVMVLNLCYQNSGWIQFGYRFALDYLPLLFVLLALTGRRFGGGFLAAAVFSIAINTFGAITFDRAPQFYDNDNSQRTLFQPD